MSFTPRSIHINNTPDGQWEIEVGEMGGERWSGVARIAHMGHIFNLYANFGERSGYVDWHLIPRANAVSESPTIPGGLLGSMTDQMVETIVHAAVRSTEIEPEGSTV